MKSTSKKKRLLPGFGLSMGVTIFYLTLIVLIPLSTLFLKTSLMSFAAFWDTIISPRTLAALRLSFGAAFVAALISAPFGFLTAWVLTRYSFPGRAIINALIDLPFALPTAIAGIALATIYSSNGWIGKVLYPLGLKTAYSQTGITLALIFIGFPFVVRTVGPVLEDLDPAIEAAASSLGAGRWQTFRRVIFPSLLPPLSAGFTMAFARAIGEYGSVVFIAGNMPMKTEIAPLLIMTKLEQYDYAGATAIALVMLVTSFALFFVINSLQAWGARKVGVET